MENIKELRLKIFALFNKTVNDIDNEEAELFFSEVFADLDYTFDYFESSPQISHDEDFTRVTKLILQKLKLILEKLYFLYPIKVTKSIKNTTNDTFEKYLRERFENHLTNGRVDNAVILYMCKISENICSKNEFKKNIFNKSVPIQTIQNYLYTQKKHSTDISKLEKNTLELINRELRTEKGISIFKGKCKTKLKEYIIKEISKEKSNNRIKNNNFAIQKDILNLRSQLIFSEIKSLIEKEIEINQIWDSISI